MASTRTRLDPNALQLRPTWSPPTSGPTRPRVAWRVRRCRSRYTGNANPADDLATPVRSTASSTTPSTLRRSGRATAAATPASTATATRRARPARHHLGHRPRHVVRGVAGRRPGDRRGHRPAANRSPRRRARGRARRAAGRDDGRQRGGHDAREPSGRDPLWRRAEGRCRSAHGASEPAGHAPNHSTMLNKAEMRLVTEWMDLGGQYFNNPFDSSAMAANPLSETMFNSQILRSCRAPARQAATRRAASGLDGGSGNIVPRQPLRADRQPGG